MEKKFFSQQNIENQVNELIIRLKLSKTNKIQEKCKLLMIKHMQNAFNTFKNKKPIQMSEKEFLMKLNKKCIINCINFYNQRKSEKILGNMDKLHRQRDLEVNGKRNIIIPTQSEYTLKSTRKMPENNNYANYEYIETSQPSYVSASGETKYGTINFANNTAKKNAVQDIRIGHMTDRHDNSNLEQRFQEQLEFRESYDKRKKPAEINFAQDGGDSRVKPQELDFSQFETNQTDLLESNLFNLNNDNLNNDNSNMQKLMEMVQNLMHQNNNKQNQYDNTRNQYDNKQYDNKQNEHVQYMDMNTDIKTRLNNLMNERDKIDSLAKLNTGQKFDPMKSPNKAANDFFFDQALKFIFELKEDDIKKMNLEDTKKLYKLFYFILSRDNIPPKEVIEPIILKKTITINSENYNNACDITLSCEQLQNVKYIIINSANFSEFMPNVNDKSNTLSIKLSENTEYLTFVLKTEEYTILNLLFLLKQTLLSLNLNIDINLTSNNHIEFISEHKFDLKYHDDSIMRLLGFQQDIYENQTKYTSESPYNLNLFKQVDIYVNDYYIAMLNLENIESNKYPIITEIESENITEINLVITQHNNKDVIYEFSKPYNINLEFDFE